MDEAKKNVKGNVHGVHDTEVGKQLVKLSSLWTQNKTEEEAEEMDKKI